MRIPARAAQPLPLQPGLQVEDGVPDDLDHVVKVIDGLVDAAAHHRVTREHRGTLQVQPDGEDPLDDLVLQFGGYAIAFPHDVGGTAWAGRLSLFDW